MRRRPAALAAVLLVAVPAMAAIAAASPARHPPPAPPALPAAIQFVTADSVKLAGVWFAGPAKSASIVIAPRRRGREADLLETAAEFQRRGFGALVFSLRDSLPADRERDSLRYVVLASHWVDDMVAALKAVRARVDSTRHVFAWGQGLGGALAIGAAAREIGLCDAVAAEDVFPTADYVMRNNGMAVIPEAVRAQFRALSGGDEPFSAASRLRIPVFGILVGHDAGGPGDAALAALQRTRGPLERWLRPGVVSPAPPPGPAQIDTLANWFRRWTAYPRQP